MADPKKADETSKAPKAEGESFETNKPEAGVPVNPGTIASKKADADKASEQEQVDAKQEKLAGKTGDQAVRDKHYYEDGVDKEGNGGIDPLHPDESKEAQEKAKADAKEAEKSAKSDTKSKDEE